MSENKLVQQTAYPQLQKNWIPKLPIRKFLRLTVLENVCKFWFIAFENWRRKNTINTLTKYFTFIITQMFTHIRALRAEIHYLRSCDCGSVLKVDNCLINAHNSSFLLFIIVFLLLHLLFPNLFAFVCVYRHNADPVFALYVYCIQYS